MKHLEEYRNTFEKIKSIKNPDERKTKLEKLLDQYRNDNNIRILAHGYSFSGDVKEADNLLHLELDMCEEIGNFEVDLESMSKRERLSHFLKRIDQHLKESVYRGYATEAYRRKYGTLTWKDLRKIYRSNSLPSLGSLTV